MMLRPEPTRGRCGGLRSQWLTLEPAQSSQRPEPQRENTSREMVDMHSSEEPDSCAETSGRGIYDAIGRYGDGQPWARG